MLGTVGSTLFFTKSRRVEIKLKRPGVNVSNFQNVPGRGMPNPE